MILGPFRIRFGLPTRRKKERPTELDIHLWRPNQVSQKTIPVHEFPLVYHTVKLPPPRVVLDLPLSETHDCEMVAIAREEDIARYAGKHGEGFSVGAFEPIAFLRFLAKVAHSFAIGRLGVDHFEPVLPDVILGKPEVPTNSLFQFIGGGSKIEVGAYSDPTLRTLHCLDTRSDNSTGTRYVIVSLQLFSFLSAPTYDVVVGIYRNPSSIAA
jgi:hypothetical protein